MIDSLTEDAMIARMFVATGISPSLDVMQTVLRKGAKKGRWRQNGTTFLRLEGHPEIVWTKGWIVRSGQEDHEILTTYVRHAINATESWRHDLDRDIRMDLLVRMTNTEHENLTAAVEVDMNKTSYDRIVEERYKAYVENDWQSVILWVVHSETPASARTRMEGLRKRAEAIKDRAFFTTTYELLKRPGEDVFVDFAGKPWKLGKGNGPYVGRRIGDLVLNGIGKPWP